jgi:hypothetical protein
MSGTLATKCFLVIEIINDQTGLLIYVSGEKIN